MILKNQISTRNGIASDCGLGALEAGPREQRQTQVDGAGVERVDGGFEIGVEGLVGVERTGDGDQSLRQIRPDAPVVRFVGVGQSRLRNAAAEAEMVEPRSQRAQADFDVAQALTTGQLGESHGQKLVHAGKTAMAPVAPVATHAAMKIVSGKVIHHLGEDGAAGVHAPL